MDHLERDLNLIFSMRWPVGHLNAMSRFGTATGYFPARPFESYSSRLGIAMSRRGQKCKDRATDVWERRWRSGRLAMIARLRRAEAALALVLAWGIVFLLPTAWMKRLFGRVDAPTLATAVDKAELARVLSVMRRLNWVAELLPWSSTCLVRALAGRLLLDRRGIRGGVVRFGVKLDRNRVHAHAWLMLGPVPILGGEEAERYTPIADLKR
ncbi:lasso peptide biosynthesis B2 protein (plasmid) [Thalassobaculum sp. OXR-137]|uniref:lasso peptide biosynthesis B2 protein n=1 Tax=Thalassobaculum sp. OXR-137 TaxID=3100173 RepID=UPI002AC9533A|nr:lasso peptide biosynthesis B2 protein [Thalassobaculum sp. OXR-137]WPZ37282.1 lasso peptide biosynthesis B2 protein [Thalassobaculum sp. OXR-137]